MVTVIVPKLVVLLGFPHPAVLAKDARVRCWLAQKSAPPVLMSGHFQGLNSPLALDEVTVITPKSFPSLVTPLRF